MKTKLLFLVFTFMCTASFAQLSISETLNYIQKKVLETKDLEKSFDKYTYRITDVAVGKDKANANKIIIQYTRTFSDNTTDILQYIFDPTHLSSISLGTDASSTETVGLINLYFIGNSVLLKKSTNGTVEDSNKSSFVLPFFRVDTLNYERLKKAFFHLKESYAGLKTPDPFAN